ncbi:MAG: hypothetical protein IJ638_01565, partial [Alphaproteobacteria bacterium]|nr:hypothetical protein [Alphaproteobacteria bacterium]
MSTDQNKENYSDKLKSGDSELTQDDLNANDTELSKYGKSGVCIEKDGKKVCVKSHNVKDDIKLISEDELKGKEPDKLQKILDNLKKHSDTVEKEKEKTKDNINALRKKKVDDDKKSKEDAELEELKK